MLYREEVFGPQITALVEKVPTALVERFPLPKSYWKNRGWKEQYEAAVITVPNYRLPEHWWTRFVDIKMLIGPGFPNVYDMSFWLTGRPMVAYNHPSHSQHGQPCSARGVAFREDRVIDGYPVPARGKQLYPVMPLYRVHMQLEDSIRCEGKALAVYWQLIRHFFNTVGTPEYDRKMSGYFPD